MFVTLKPQQQSLPQLFSMQASWCQNSYNYAKHLRNQFSNPQVVPTMPTHNQEGSHRRHINHESGLGFSP